MPPEDQKPPEASDTTPEDGYQLWRVTKEEAEQIRREVYKDIMRVYGIDLSTR